MLECNTGVTLSLMPTKRRRHAITETPPVQAALDQLRREAGTDDVGLPELVILGAREKVEQLQVERGRRLAARKRLADRVRVGKLPGEQAAAEEVRRSGWTRG